MVGRLELNDAVGMASIFSTRNDTNWSTSNNHNVGVKSSFSNPNPNRNPKPSRNPNSFSRKQLNHKINNVDVNELISGDKTSFNQINRRISPGNVGVDRDDARVLYSQYVRYDISGFSRGELRDLRLKLVSELDKVRTFSCKIDSSTKKRSKPSQFPPEPKRVVSNTIMPAQTVQTVPEVQTAQVESYVASPVVMNMCKTVLRKLSSQKAGIWFNSPVDAVSMGLHDYHTVINRPMDLGTIKGNLERRVYNTPVEFADDVRLTFNNALRYNPKGHEVNAFATQYLALFERCFVPVFAKFNSEKLYHLHQSGPRKTLPFPPPGPTPLPVSKDDLSVVLDGSFTKLPSPEPRMTAEIVKPMKKSVKKTEKKAEMEIEKRHEPVAMVERVERRGRPREKLPKPKAKDGNKRGMSMEEKQKLGEGLMSLSGDKMEQVVNIIRKRSKDLSQVGDEIELDFEVLDVETLWELDRLLTNHKKNVSKITRQEVYPPSNYNVDLIDDSSQAGTSEMMVEMTMVKNGDVVEEDVDIGGDEMPVNNFPPLQIDKDDDRQQHQGGSSSSGTSSSDGSSSSDSDSGSSSGSDSDVDDAQSCDKQSKISHL